MSAQEKSEDATSHKLMEARDKGQVNKSMEVTGTVLLSFFVAIFFFTAPQAMEEFRGLASNIIRASSSLNFSLPVLGHFFVSVFVEIFAIVAPAMGLLVCSAVIANVIQTGLLFSSHPITPDFKKLNPISGLKKLFAIKTLFELGKVLVKALVITLLAYFFWRDWLEQLMAFYGMSYPQLGEYWFSLAIQVVIMTLLLLLPFVLFDFAFSRWNFAKQMRMSKQDVKDEYKKREGDPQIKQKQKQIQKEMLKKAAALTNVKNADAIITNPTHVAVALKFTPHKMPAPMVLAMGEEKTAEKIRALGRKYRVPIYRRPPLARLIYQNSIIDGYIPEKAYAETAEIFRELLNKATNQPKDAR